MVINTPNLIIPHPRMLERLFVLVPLMELNPKLINPVSGDSIYRIFKSLLFDVCFKISKQHS